MVNKRVLKDKVKIDGQEITVAVVKPDQKQARQATKVYNKAWAEGIEDGGLLAIKVEQVLRKQNIWDDEKQAEYEKLTKTLNDGELTLKRKAVMEGGSLKRLKKEDAKKLALEMAKARAERLMLVMERNALESNTVEAQARNAKFNYQCSVCIINNETGDPIFRDVDDYMERGNEPWVVEAATQLASLIDGYDLDFQKNLPENKFLVDYKFAKYDNNMLRLIDDKGRFVDEKGRLLNKDGRFINENGNFVDGDGRPVNEQGDYILADAFETFEDEVPQEAASKA